MNFVLDNSVCMRWCFGDGKRSELVYAERTLDALREQSAVVPAIWGLEVANVLSRAEAQGMIDTKRSATFLALLRDLRIEVDPATASHALTSTLELARRHRLSAYDAAYLELAVRWELPLATLDTNLRKALKRACVELV